ncbi:hypothetical protein OIU84_019337 [Salix udensis]|uniref:Uncharacterized protein n=1 Tax=Salix udensis TaxID=889485 RepID=A0AAD6PIX7_9ROSI|nr:hypothetical protein OIU84_019337 [Salix udensis]
MRILHVTLKGNCRIMLGRNFPGSFSTEIEIIFRLFIWGECTKVFLQLWLLLIFIKHGEYVSLYSFSRPLRRTSFHMPNQIREISTCVI